jgi:uncharacterized protein (TIGR01777 family)
MRIVVAGGTGFLGRPLVEALARAGHDLIVLSRRGASPPSPGRVWSESPAVREMRWSASDDLAGWAHVLHGADVVINLAGEPIAGRRWTDEQKRRLRDSRLDTSRAVARAIHAAEPPPTLLLNASAVGYYGSRGDTRLVERSSAGDDFLGRLCVEWETVASAAAGADTRVVYLRSGIVLERGGGALRSMLLPFRLFAGGPVGSGDQYMSWIHRADWIALVAWLLTTTEDGPFNATAPEPVTNAQFAEVLGRTIHRPSWLPAPAFALRLLLGEMADAILIGGQRVVPQRALELGFQFAYPTLDAALAQIFDKPEW